MSEEKVTHCLWCGEPLVLRTPYPLLIDEGQQIPYCSWSCAMAHTRKRLQEALRKEVGDDCRCWNCNVACRAAVVESDGVTTGMFCSRECADVWLRKTGQREVERSEGELFVEDERERKRAAERGGYRPLRGYTF